MLGDIGAYWQILVGAILIWVALGMFGLQSCSTGGGRLLERFNIRGYRGALLLGLSYGILSGSCTFGFIAPILAVITIQQKISIGVLFILLFAAGHCFPIFIAGTSMAAVRGILENRAWQGIGVWFRKGAGIVIALLGIYFLLNPFFSI